MGKEHYICDTDQGNPAEFDHKLPPKNNLMSYYTGGLHPYAEGACAAISLQGQVLTLAIGKKII